ncbi:flagellar hook-basal body complex protein FliE [Candidatus Bathyarchaeota archaeon]|nr:flagellar hook-basal body complex protein FliE [Candidatus Bathyarchaeota archaeon]
MKADKLVVGLAGMPGSGKSLVVETARAEGYAVVVMGDVVREETKARGLELNPKNIGKVMLELRKNGGASVIADKCIPKIERKRSRKVIVDGIRSLSEVDAFKTHFPHFSLIAVHASSEARFNRLYRRRRSDDPDGWDLFNERDMRELGVGVGNAIAMAEHLIVNENNREATKARARKVFWRIERKWAR